MKPYGSSNAFKFFVQLERAPFLVQVALLFGVGAIIWARDLKKHALSLVRGK